MTFSRFLPRFRIHIPKTFFLILNSHLQDGEISNALKLPTLAGSKDRPSSELPTLPESIANAPGGKLPTVEGSGSRRETSESPSGIANAPGLPTLAGAKSISGSSSKLPTGDDPVSSGIANAGELPTLDSG